MCIVLTIIVMDFIGLVMSHVCFSIVTITLVMVQNGVNTSWVKLGELLESWWESQS
jgi:hypothetical protein